MNKKYNIFFFLFFLLIIYLILYSLDPTLLWDENVYLGNARNQISHSNFTEDFRFPLLEYIIAFFWIFTGESIFVAKIVIILITIATLFFFFLIIKKYFKKNLILFTFLFGISPVLLKWGFRIYTDVPALFFIILSFYFILLEKDKYIFFQVLLLLYHF